LTIFHIKWLAVIGKLSKVSSSFGAKATWLCSMKAKLSRLRRINMHRSLIAASFAVLTLASATEPLIAQGYTKKPVNSDWPCQQILVHNISIPAVWAGPSIEGVNWQSDSKLVDLIDKIAPRRLPLEEAQQDIADFAKTLGPDKNAKLTALFAGLFHKLDQERVQLIDGLDRFGHKQKELGDKLRDETAELHAAQDKAGAAPLPDLKDQSNPTSAPGPGASILEKLQWDLRIFQDRHKAVSFVCESPVLIEQRLFALAHTIQDNMN